MKLYEILESQLKSENNFVTDNGELKKWVVINKAQNYDADLIALLLDDKELKEKFFIDVKGALVFNQNLFVQFLEQKNYLNDSYTQYKNKVGLTIDGKYLKQRNEVALVWPFKDCILEGGQSREEDKREEIFFNEILAQDEITQLLEPKVLTNAKTYNKDGEKEFFGFTRDAELNRKRGLPESTITDNLIIKGNNLLALHSLKKEFTGKVKLIYIDPPYNTGSDGFEYNDNFNHSSWLTFIKNRLNTAKKLLKQDGTIAVSIDHNELSYLLIVMDEIFGKENLKNIITIKRGSVTGAKVINPGVVNISEYVVIYSKSASNWKPNRVYSSKDWDRRYNGFILNFEQGFKNWRFTTVLEAFADKVKVKKSKLKKHFGEDYEIELESFVYENAEKIMQRATLDINSISQGAKKMKEESINNPDKVLFLERKNAKPYYIYNGKLILFAKDRMTKIDGKETFSQPITDIWNDVLPNDLHNEGGVELRKGKKPEKLISRLVELCTNENDLVFDFFSGSGTTGSVSMKLGRQFIICEQLEYTETLPLQRLINTINGEQSGVSKAYDWNGGGSFTYIELKKHNQTFIDLIKEAKDLNALLAIWAEMKAKSFINYNVDIQKQEEHIDDFKKLNLVKQKQHLVEILDKNQLYVNLSSLDDKDFACSDKEKKVTKDFYQLNND